MSTKGRPREIDTDHPLVQLSGILITKEMADKIDALAQTEFGRLSRSMVVRTILEKVLAGR